MVSGVFSVLGLTLTVVLSFIASAITIVSLSSLKVLDSGLADGTNRILFILIFGALFYGGTILSTYTMGGVPSVILVGKDGKNINVLLTSNSTIGIIDIKDAGNVNTTTIPTFIHQLSYGTGLFHYDIVNPNYDSNSSNTGFGYSFGFGEGANNINDQSFQSMPYYSVVNLIFGLMYILGLYFMVANPAG